MKSWRPEGWGNPYPDGTEVVLTEKHLIQAMEYPQSNYEVYDAGADAMLDALRKTGEHRESKWVDDTFGLHTEIAGTLVFIPDDEDSK